MLVDIARLVNDQRCARSGAQHRCLQEAAFVVATGNIICSGYSRNRRGRSRAAVRGESTTEIRVLELVQHPAQFR
jgi:hypothetical protein